MNFYPWQTRALDTLLAQMGTGKLPHAILLTGAEGIGKLNFALTFAQRFFCQQASGVSPCGQCDACHKFLAETHPDVKRIAPAEGKQVIAVDQIRALIEYVSLTPHSASKKVVIIEQAELLNVNAANSLLKTLEEPPESSMLILVTHRPDRLLPTIRSRCQAMLFPTPDAAQASTWLSDQLKTDENISTLLALSGGAPLKALGYAEDNMLEKRNNFFSELEQISSGKKNPIDVAKSWHKNDFELTVNCLTSWVTDMIRLKALERQTSISAGVISKEFLSNSDLQTALTKITKTAGLKAMLDYYQSLTKVTQLKKSNINPQMILENVLIDWQSLSRRDK